MTRPVEDLRQRQPEGFLLEVRVSHIGPADNQAIQPVVAYFRKRLVIPVDVSLGRFAAREPFDGEGMHVKLHDRVGGADQPIKLPFGGFQGRIRHHVQQPDVHLADILMPRALHSQDFLTLFAQAPKGWEIRMGNQGHILNLPPLSATAHGPARH